MNWISTYIDDLNTQQKRQVRQRVLKECQVSNRSFYEYLDGKQGREIVMNKIDAIVTEVRKEKKSATMLEPEYA
jgi:hypothetical protein